MEFSGKQTGEIPHRNPAHQTFESDGLDAPASTIRPAAACPHLTQQSVSQGTSICVPSMASGRRTGSVSLFQAESIAGALGETSEGNCILVRGEKFIIYFNALRTKPSAVQHFCEGTLCVPIGASYEARSKRRQ